MAIAKKDLTALNSTIELSIDHEIAHTLGVHYISGAGTLVLSVSCDGGTTWSVMCVIDAGDTAQAVAANMTSTGFYTAVALAGVTNVKVEKTVGAAACVAALSVSV